MRSHRRQLLVCWLGCELAMCGAALLLGGGTRSIVGWAAPLAGVLLLACAVLGGLVPHPPAADAVAAAAVGAAQLAVVALVWADPRPAPAWQAMITVIAVIGTGL